MVNLSDFPLLHTNKCCEVAVIFHMFETFTQKKTAHRGLQTKTRWWFRIFSIFTPTLGNDPIWLIFCNWVETTTLKR